MSSIESVNNLTKSRIFILFDPFLRTLVMFIMNYASNNLFSVRNAMFMML